MSLRSPQSFSLRFNKACIIELANRYLIADDRELEHEISPRSKQRGYIAKNDFLVLSKWKSPRSQSWVKSNAPDLIEEATRIALSTSPETMRIGVLTLLRGVSWPTASVVLHFVHRDPYPILDFRALWSLSIETPPSSYTFSFWWDYACFCRDLAVECGVNMRTLDRALWQFSKENQG